MNIYLESFTILSVILLIALGSAAEEKANTAAYNEAKKGKKADRFILHILTHVMDIWMGASTLFTIGSFVDLLKHPYWNHPITYIAGLAAYAAMVMFLAYMTRYVHRVSNGRERAYEKVMEQEAIKQMFAGV